MTLRSSVDLASTRLLGVRPFAPEKSDHHMHWEGGSEGKKRLETTESTRERGRRGEILRAGEREEEGGREGGRESKRANERKRDRQTDRERERQTERERERESRERERERDSVKSRTSGTNNQAY